MQFENQIIGSINFFTPRPFDRYSIILPVLNRFDFLLYSLIFHILLSHSMIYLTYIYSICYFIQ